MIYTMIYTSLAVILGLKGLEAMSSCEKCGQWPMALHLLRQMVEAGQ